MTQRELEKLLKSPEVLRELEQGLFGDPALWASAEELQAAQSAEELLERKRMQIKEQVMRRLTQTGEERRAMPPRRMGRRALQWSVAAACVALFGCYIAFYPQAKSLATAHEERVARKVEGHLIIEGAEDAKENTGMRVSGVDGFEMYSYNNIDEYIQKTGRDPVLLTGGYERIASISDELDPNHGYTLMIAYELTSGEYISTSQLYSQKHHETIFADSFERVVLGDKTMFCRVEDDSSGTYGLVRLSDDCTFFLYVPYAEQFDPYLAHLSFASEVDTSSFVVSLPEPAPQTEKDEEFSPRQTSYATFEEFSRGSGYWPVILDEAYAKPVSIEYYSGILTKVLTVEYEKDGHSIYAFQHFDATGGEAYSMEDATYFTTKILGKYTMHCSVDLQDGSTTGVAVVNGSSFCIIAEKEVDFNDMLQHLYIMEHQ